MNDKFNQPEKSGSKVNPQETDDVTKSVKEVEDQHQEVNEQHQLEKDEELKSKEQETTANLSEQKEEGTAEKDEPQQGKVNEEIEQNKEDTTQKDEPQQEEVKEEIEPKEEDITEKDEPQQEKVNEEIEQKAENTIEKNEPQQEKAKEETEPKEVPYKAPSVALPNTTHIPPSADDKEDSGFGLAALILGIVGLVIGMIPFIGWLMIPAWVLAIVFGILSLKKTSASRGFAITGIVLGVTTIVFKIGFWIFIICANMTSSMFDRL